MSEIRKVWKLLLKKDFYEKHKLTLPVSSFDDIGKELLQTIEVAHSKSDKDLTEAELMLIHLSENPSLTTAAKNTFAAYLRAVREEPEVSASIADAVYSSLWKKEVGRFIGEYGIRLEEGDRENVDELVNYLTSINTSFMPEDFTNPVDTDPISLFAKINSRGKWGLNIPTLNAKIGNVSPGQFIIILARPESGKTATIVNLMAGREGFAAQGAKVHLICNEEGADVTAGRAICCFNQISVTAVKADPSIAKTEAWEKVRQNMVFLHRPEITMGQLENYCKQHKPDVIIIDQLDHIAVSGSFEKGHERLGIVYRKARELASKYDCVVIGVSQASAEGESKSKITYAMAEGSKTSKAAAADLILGIGKADDNAMEESNEVLRYYTVSKNKISGYKGTVIAKLIQDQSRLIS